MNELKGACLLGQSGGPTAVINASAYGVIEAALRNPLITRVYGAANGIKGILDDKMYDMNQEDPQELALLLQTPSSALGSCRYKLKDPEVDAADYQRLLEVFKKRNIRYFFYIGGNDSMDTVAKLTEYLKTSDYEMCAVGIPKTIDNDLMGTDHTPGFGSAAKYIATTMSEIIRDCAVYTIPAVTIVEIMGRDAGWLTASAGLGRLVSGYAPDLIYLPEVTFDMDAFFADVQAALAKHPNVVVAVSEGVRFADGHYVGEGTQSGSTDAFGHKYLAGTGKALELAVKEKIGCKVRSIELNLPQRCAAHLSSLTDLTESTGAGQAAVEAACGGMSGRMISICRTEAAEYAVTYKAEDIAKIANAVRAVPREFINESGSNVTDECLRYILPLIQGEPEIRYEGGLPVQLVIK